MFTKRHKRTFIAASNPKAWQQKSGQIQYSSHTMGYYAAETMNELQATFSKKKKSES